MCKKQLYFYTATENHAKKKIFRKLILFTVTQKGKILGTKLTKEVKDLDTENCKTLMKENKEDTSKCKDTPSSWIGRHNIIKMPT